METNLAALERSAGRKRWEDTAPGLPNQANRPGGEVLYAGWPFLLRMPLEAILATLVEVGVA